MADTRLTDLPEPVRFELAKSTLTTALMECIQTLGLSNTTALAALECVLSEQRDGLCGLLASSVVQASGVQLAEEGGAGDADPRD